MMESLSMASRDRNLTVRWCFLNEEEHRLAESVGLAQGAKIRVIASCGGCVIVSVGEARLALGKKAAERIKV